MHPLFQVDSNTITSSTIFLTAIRPHTHTFSRSFLLKGICIDIFFINRIRFILVEEFEHFMVNETIQKAQEIKVFLSERLVRRYLARNG